MFSNSKVEMKINFDSLLSEYDKDRIRDKIIDNLERHFSALFSESFHIKPNSVYFINSDLFVLFEVDFDLDVYMHYHSNDLIEDILEKIECKIQTGVTNVLALVKQSLITTNYMIKSIDINGLKEPDLSKVVKDNFNNYYNHKESVNHQISVLMNVA